MKVKNIVVAVIASAGIAIISVEAAIAHDSAPGMMQDGGKGRGVMQGGGMGRGMMRGGGMGRGMMRGGGMGRGMMHRGGMGRGFGTMFGQRVSPMLNLSVDDVRNYLSWRLEQAGNKRLKVGEVKVDNGAITADIATVDDSLVQRLKVDRRTGMISYGN